MVTLTDNDIVSAVTRNPPKKAVLLFSNFWRIFLLCGSLRKEKLLSKVNSHPIISTSPIITVSAVLDTCVLTMLETSPVIFSKAPLITNPSEILIARECMRSPLRIGMINMAAKKVILNVTKNCITVIPSDLLSDFPLSNMSRPVMRRNEFTPPLVPITMAARLVADRLSVSPSEINAPAIGEPDIVISVIRYEMKNDLTGESKKFAKNSV